MTQHRRTAIIVGSVVFGIAALFSATLAGFDLAVRLEAQLYDRIEIAAGDGSLKLGETLRAMRRIRLRARNDRQACQL